MLIAHFYIFSTDKDSESASDSFGDALILFLFFGAVAVTAYLYIHDTEKVRKRSVNLGIVIYLQKVSFSLHIRKLVAIVTPVL